MERLRNERFKAEIACIWDNAKASEARAVSVSLTEFPLSKSAPAARAHQVDVETTWPSAKKKKNNYLPMGRAKCIQTVALCDKLQHGSRDAHCRKHWDLVWESNSGTEPDRY